MRSAARLANERISRVNTHEFVGRISESIMPVADYARLTHGARAFHGGYSLLKSRELCLGELSVASNVRERSPTELRLKYLSTILGPLRAIYNSRRDPGQGSICNFKCRAR